MSATETRTRSRAGCLTCRKKRKKCDQNKPKCGLCGRRNISCEWPRAGVTATNKPRKRIVPKFIIYNRHARDKEDEQLQLQVSESPLNMEQILESTSTFDSFLRSMALSPAQFPDILATIEQFTTPLLDSPSYPLVVPLNAVETDYFEYYCNFVAPTISVVPKAYNYFLNIFLPMAYREESIIYAMVAWGCIFRRFNDNAEVSKNSGTEYIQRALMALRHDNNFIGSLTTYIILMCIDITTGGTLEWSFYLTNCYDLINNMGGFSVLKQYPEEGKVIAENFAFFDILASQSNENGTYYPVAEYTSIFGSNNNGYVDSLAGCTRPLILILGDIVNLVVETNKVQEDYSVEHFRAMERILYKAEEAEKRLTSAEIYDSDYQILTHDSGDEIDLHSRMFELYRVTIEIYIKQAIRRLPPSVPEIQIRVNRAFELIGSLVDSCLIAGVCFPILVLGVNSVSSENKNKFSSYLASLSSKYEFSTLSKIEHIVNEVWRLNDNGRLCIDYFKVTKRFGWKLNIGSLAEKLVKTPNNKEQWDHNVQINKLASVKGNEHRPAADQDQNQAEADPYEVGVRKERRPKRQVRSQIALFQPTNSESVASENDSSPNNESTHASKTNNITIGNGRRTVHGQQREESKQVDGKSSDIRNTAFGNFSEYFWSVAINSKSQKTSAAKVNGTVDGRDTGDQDNGGDEIASVGPTSVDQSDRHRRPHHSVVFRQVGVVPGHGDTVGDGHPKVDVKDPEDRASDGFSDGFLDVSQLRERDRQALDARVEHTGVDKRVGDTLEAMCQRKLFERVSWRVALYSSSSIDHSKDVEAADEQNLDKRKNVLDLAKHIDAKHAVDGEAEPEDQVVAVNRDLVAVERQHRRH